MNSGWERSNCEQLRIIPKAKNSHSFSDASPRPSARETLDHPANKRGQQVFCSNTSTLKYRAACSPDRLAQTWHPRFDPSCGSLARHLETRALASYHLSCMTPALYQTGGGVPLCFFPRRCPGAVFVVSRRNTTLCSWRNRIRLHFESLLPHNAFTDRRGQTACHAELLNPRNGLSAGAG